METKVKISVLQGICATLILVAYFLPWFQISFMGFEGSTSLVEAIIRITHVTQDVSRFSDDMFQSNSSGTVALFQLLYLLPVVAFINTIIQWVYNASRCAFYLNLIAIGVCVLLIGYAAKLGVDLSRFTGIGLYITLIAGIISAFAAWTTIGMNYYNRYKRYMKILTYCLLISVGLFITQILFLMVGRLTDSPIFSMIGVLTVLQGIFLVISLPHAPFLIYAWIVVLCTKDAQKKMIADMDTATSSTPLETDKATVFPSSENICPQCHKPMAIDWNTCPYCGCNSKEEEEEKKKQEEDNLRFAPPKYRKEN